MRLFLLPISTRRTLLYCLKTDAVNSQQQSVVDKVQARAVKLWADWEKKDKGWQKKIVDYGNYAFRRIPYEEWGLKSVPPLSTKRREDALAGASKIDVVYPSSLIPTDRVTGVLNTLSTEREGLHRKRLIWCLVGMPITAPFALIPVIPNLPFFYLVYRAWSHWRAMAGGKHIQFLLQNKFLNLTPSPILDQLYVTRKQPLLPSPERIEVPATSNPQKDIESGDSLTLDTEAMLLSQPSGKNLAEMLEIPELEVELERAVWQVETTIEKQNAEGAEKASATTPTSDKSNNSVMQDDKKSQ